MDDLRARLQEDLTYHFKNRDELETSTLRSLLGTVQTLEKSGKVETVYTGEQILAVIGKEVKKRRDTAAEYTGLGVPERAARETAEADFLAAYLRLPPKPRSSPWSRAWSASWTVPASRTWVR